MNIEFSEKDGRKIAALCGNLDGMTAERAREKLMTAVTDKVKLTLDMGECPYISSAGLRTVLTIGKAVKKAGGDMILTNVCDEVKDVMDMTGFSELFRTFE